jgi:SNF2 family DNA or RNA helicase
MINPVIIKRFLARKLTSFDWIKKQTPLEVAIALESLQPPPNFGKAQLWQHQKACFLLLEAMQRLILFIGMGGGKTFTVLSIIRYRKQRGEEPKAIIFVPYLTSVETWVEEIEKHAPDLQCVACLGTTADNLASLRMDADLHVICYQSAVAMLGESYAHKGKTKWRIKPHKVRKVFRDFDMLVMDEIHKCKSASSLTYRMCRTISAKCDWVIGLTGTPFSRNPIDLWPQFYLIDFGETLGPTLGIFREAFCTIRTGRFAKFDYKFKKKMLPDLNRMMKNASIHYDIKEFADMPPKNEIKIRLDLPPDYKGYCDAAIKSINNAAKRQGLEAYQEMESSYNQLRQLSSGFMTLKGQDDDKIHIQFLDNPKLDKLEELIDSMPIDQKMVVFHHFVYTSKMISERLIKMKVEHARIWGGQKDPIGELRRFKRRPQCRVLVINDQSGSSSLNLQNANYLVFFEQPVSAINQQQAVSRVWRPGQDKRVFIYNLFMKETADYRIYKANAAGANLLKQVMKGDEL